MVLKRQDPNPTQGLNESPSKKEGKFERGPMSRLSLKSLNESPSKKEGKS